MVAIAILGDDGEKLKCPKRLLQLQWSSLQTSAIVSNHLPHLPHLLRKMQSLTQSLRKMHPTPQSRTAMRLSIASLAAAVAVVAAAAVTVAAFSFKSIAFVISSVVDVASTLSDAPTSSSA